MIFFCNKILKAHPCIFKISWVVGQLLPWQLQSCPSSLSFHIPQCWSCNAFLLSWCHSFFWSPSLCPLISKLFKIGLSTPSSPSLLFSKWSFRLCFPLSAFDNAVFTWKRLAVSSALFLHLQTQLFFSVLIFSAAVTWHAQMLELECNVLCSN